LEFLIFFKSNGTCLSQNVYIKTNSQYAFIEYKGLSLLKMSLIGDSDGGDEFPMMATEF